MDRVVIYGSCVSRDTYEFMDANAYPLAVYVARQSMARLAHPSREGDAATLNSPFQRRMVEGDFRRSVLSVFADHQDAALVMIDLVDERLGLAELGDGTYITESSEVKDTGLLATAGVTRRVPFGTDEHFDYFCAGLDLVAAELTRYGLLARTRALNIPFADKFDDGSTEPHMVERADLFNTHAVRYWDAIRAAGIPILTIPDEKVTGKRDHKWGAAPFHYSDQTYQAMLEKLLAGQPSPPAAEMVPVNTSAGQVTVPAGATVMDNLLRRDLTGRVGAKSVLVDVTRNPAANGVILARELGCRVLVPVNTVQDAGRVTDDAADNDVDDHVVPVLGGISNVSADQTVDVVVADGHALAAPTPWKHLLTNGPLVIVTNEEGLSASQLSLFCTKYGYLHERHYSSSGAAVLTHVGPVTDGAVAHARRTANMLTATNLLARDLTYRLSKLTDRVAALESDKEGQTE